MSCVGVYVCACVCVFVCVCACVCVANLTGAGFNAYAYWAALPTGGWQRLLVGRDCNMWETWDGQQCNRGTGSRQG